MHKWIQKAVARMKAKGTVGSFTRAAKAHGESSKAYANTVMSDPNASSKMKKKANFVKNVSK